MRTCQFFEIIGVLNGRRDFVISAGPFAEINETTAVGAEGEVLVGGENNFATGGAEESFGHGVTVLLISTYQMLRRWKAIHGQDTLALTFDRKRGYIQVECRLESLTINSNFCKERWTY